METEILIVANPAARSGKAEQVASSVYQKIKCHFSGSAVRLAFTKRNNEATDITRKAMANHTSLIIAVGGDGTINEVVNGFFENGKLLNPACELGLINCGTGGGYAKTLNIPQSLDQQIELILQAGSVKLDVGCITYQDSWGITCKRFFVNECQLGIGSKVAALVGKKYKMLGAPVAFGLMAMIQAMRAETLRLTISYDDESPQTQPLIGLVVGNGVECAGGMKLTPDATLTDGFFDVLSIYPMSIAERLLTLSKVYSGTHVNSPRLAVRKCKKLAINASTAVAIEADGEMLGTAPFQIEVLPMLINVKAAYYPAN
ncbi:MAG: YegS/Rv2252/BmrU family lipid kinase [Bacteroidota bacterium]|nr:YegS/Rv2252/BmrU family lipid kinase [Bacteroidota bacterium]